jgi:hypothetical protein
MSDNEYQQQTKLYDTVNKISLLLHGQDGQTGLAGTVVKHGEELYGTQGTMGIATKVAILWRGHVWLYCSLSAGVGSLVTVWVQRYLIK